MRRLSHLLLALLLLLARPGAADVTDEPFERFENIAYAGTSDRQQTLDLAIPRDRTNRLPLIVFVHGGAWEAGSKQDGYGPLAPYVRSGRFAVASVEYRFSQHAIWPAQIHDCKAAIRWLRGNADRYGIDPDRIGVWGASAGGHLVAMLGVSGGVPELEGVLGAFTNVSSRVTCVVDYFGPSDLLALVQVTNHFRHADRDAPIPRLLGGLTAEKMDAARSASPVTHATEDDPPFLIVHGTRDDLVPLGQSEALERALAAARPVTAPLLIRMNGAGHGFNSPELDRRVAQFFDHHLRSASAAPPDTPIGP